MQHSRIRQIARLLSAGSYSRSQVFKTINLLIEGVLKTWYEMGFRIIKFIWFSSCKGFDAEWCALKVNQAATELRWHIPSVQILISWIACFELDKDVASVVGKIEVFPCIPRSSRSPIINSLQSSRFSVVNEFCLLTMLPFSTSLKTLWRELERSEEISLRAHNIEFDIIMEFARYINLESSWADCISRKKIWSHLKWLDVFFLYDASRPFLYQSIDQVNRLLSNLTLLANWCSGSWPLTLSF